MLPSKYRLKNKNAFTATYKTGKTFHENGITLFLGKEKSRDIPTKIGFVVSKKIHKRAVKRNRIKRLMREACRLYIKNYGNFSPKYISLIFVASAKMLDADFNVTNRIVNNLMEKVCND